MDKYEMQERMTAFAVRIVKMVDSLPPTVAGKALARQIVRSGTSPSANYRAACLAKSDKDFLNKLKMVEEELDETCHWLDIIMRSEMLSVSRLQPLHQECKELLSMVVKSVKTTKTRLKADGTIK
ncbi:MAG: four helix bundle protein [Prevotella sp.]|nr:four helix bundle protein [Prevotella sp.]MBR5633643.1 four helix bundle protein [Prevotella sp.]MBR6494718.1 four helix bundle protein [Prevotella sp.]